MNNTHAAHSDHGTVVGPDHAALVVGPDGVLTLLLPDRTDEAEALPVNMALLVSVAIRSDDPEWVKETLTVLDE